jgi:hypothetical protein
MRFFEFSNDDQGDKFVMVLRNYIGRDASKKAPSSLNWAGLNKVLSTSGFELSADYETFKAMYDGSPAIQAMVKNFNERGLELKVPGAPDDQEQSPQQAGKTSQDQVDQTADSAAAGQLAQSQQTPQVTSPQA